MGSVGSLDDEEALDEELLGEEDEDSLEEEELEEASSLDEEETIGCSLSQAAKAKAKILASPNKTLFLFIG